MAILFSAVTVTANGESAEFLVSGIPRDFYDLDAWTEFERFTDYIDEDTEVSVHAEAYLYGEGETFSATPEEIAYFTKRTAADDRFLTDHCDNIEGVDFAFQWLPSELYGMEME